MDILTDMWSPAYTISTVLKEILGVLQYVEEGRERRGGRRGEENGREEGRGGAKREERVKGIQEYPLLISNCPFSFVYFLSFSFLFFFSLFLLYFYII